MEICEQICRETLESVWMAHFIHICGSHVPVLGKDIIIVSIIGGVVCAIQIVVMICTLISTEIALKKNFDKNGNRN